MIIVESQVVVGDLVYVLPEANQCVVLRWNRDQMKLIQLEWRYESCSSFLVQEPPSGVERDVELFLDYDASYFICRNDHATWRLIGDERPE